MELNKSVPDVIIKPIERWTNVSHIVKNLIYYIGEYMHIGLIFIGYFTLINKISLYYFFAIGLCLCSLINFVLKSIIKVRRPCINPILFKMLLESEKYFITRNNKKYHIFGMPSGHSQSCGYAFIFFTLLLKDNYISLFYLSICILTMYQRVNYGHHTFLQTIIGFTIGCIFGVVTYIFLNNINSGNLKTREDDNCYI